MDNTEFSNQFDVLYNNVMSNAAPGLNEYEKSVFLTKAQNEIIKNYFNPKGNKYQEGFDDSMKRQIDFSNLIETRRLSSPVEGITYDKRGKLYDLSSEKIMFIIQESVDTNNGTFQVIPIKYNEYMQLMSKPFKEPLKWQAWRIVIDSNNRVELVAHSQDIIESYNIRYVRIPAPIVLINLSEEYGDVSIDGVSEISECELDATIHDEILQRAVELAKAAYIGDINSVTQMGQRSE